MRDGSSGVASRPRDGATDVIVAADEDDASVLTAAVLAEESSRRLAQQPTGAVVLPDDLLPGVGGDALSLRQVVRQGGVATIAVLALLNVVDEFDRVALAVLAPEIQESLGMSDTVLGAVAGVSGLLFVTAAIPLGYLADRVRRTSIVGLCSLLWAGIGSATGAVRTVWQLILTRLLSGLGKANSLPVHGGLLADAYPIAGRTRVYAIHSLANPVGVLLGPALAGAVAAAAGGDEGWRWAFVLLAVPGLLLGIAAFALPEPARGRNEQIEVLGGVAAVDDSGPMSLSAGFQRLKRIRTFYFLLVGVGVLGFALFSVPTFLNLLLRDKYGLDAWDRGVVQSLTAIGGVVAVPVGGWLGDRAFRASPPRVLLLIAGAVAAFGVVQTAVLYLPNLALFAVGHGVATALVSLAFVPIQSLVAAVAPYRLRSLAFAMVGIYIFLLGAFFGAILTGALSDRFGTRTALSVVVPPSALVGGALIAYGARFVRRDISLVVEELTEEQAERRRLELEQTQAPALQVNNLDFSYGSVQVLFDVAIEVRRGELLALLGTNGAGKSTLLRVVSGLVVPDRGVVRLHGRTITYTEAEERARMGLVQVPGGKAIFPDLTVAENLLAGGHRFGWNRRELARRSTRALEPFPRLAERLDQPAGTLSGGEQQMLALAKALMLDPEVLLVDELSLGLAPVAVQELLAVVERLKATGLTMVVVEQSVNVALSIADRAVFMEKGRVRFEGPAAELAERDDLVRAVFLGGDGG